MMLTPFEKKRFKFWVAQADAPQAGIWASTDVPGHDVTSLARVQTCLRFSASVEPENLAKEVMNTTVLPRGEFERIKSSRPEASKRIFSITPNRHTVQGPIR